MSLPHPTDEADDLFDPSELVEDEDTDEPGEATFWQAYNRNLEFPIAGLLSVFAHLLVVAGLVLVILLAMSRSKDTSPVPISLVDSGLDDSGRGNPNDGGDPIPITNGDNNPTQADMDNLPSIDEMPEIKERIEKDISLDPELADVKIPDDKVAPLAGLAQELQNKLAQVGQRKGAGGVGATGVGGTGSDSTRARSLRWVLRFRITTGREYLNQLAGMGAVVVIPIPPVNKSAYVFKDLSGNGKGEMMADGEWMQLAQKVQFCDYKRDVVQQVVKELKAPVEAHAFWAFFPKDWEDRLATMERNHQNRRSEDIQETVFQVILRNGKYDLEVVRQTLKN